MKIVLDTNCLLPAVFPRSIYHWLWESFRRGDFILCYSNEIITDNKFADCALNAGVDYIVTNDKHFNILKRIEFQPLKVIDIETFKKKICR